MTKDELFQDKYIVVWDKGSLKGNLAMNLAWDTIEQAECRCSEELGQSVKKVKYFEYLMRQGRIRGTLGHIKAVSVSLHSVSNEDLAACFTFNELCDLIGYEDCQLISYHDKESGDNFIEVSQVIKLSDEEFAPVQSCEDEIKKERKVKERQEKLRRLEALKREPFDESL